MFNSNQAINQEDREIADFFTEKCLLNRTHRNVINTKSNIMSNPVEILWKSCGNPVEILWKSLSNAIPAICK